MVRYDVRDKNDANQLLRLAWAIAKCRVRKPYHSAVRELLDIRDSLLFAGFWWQANRVEGALHYFIKVHHNNRSEQ